MTESPSSRATLSTTRRFIDDLRTFAWTIRRGWRVLAASVAVCVTLALVYLSAATRLYEATVQLLVLQHGGRLFNVANADTSRPPEAGDDYIPSQVAIVRSPAVVKRAIDSVGLENLPTLRAAQERGLDPVREVIDTYLTVPRPERLVKVIRIDYRARSADEAVRMAEAVAASYRKFLEENYPRGTEVVALMDRARRELGADVEKAEKDYLDFRLKHPLLVTDEKGRSFMTNRLEHWDRAINDAQVRETRLKAQLELARKLSKEGAGLWAIVHAMNQLSGDSGNGLLNYPTNAAQITSWDYVRQLSQEQQLLAERYGPHYSKVQDLQEQITRIQERVRTSRSRCEQVEVSDLIKSLEQGVNTSVAMRATLGQGFEQDKKIEGDFLVEMTLRGNLERCRALFNAAVDQLKQAQVDRDFSPVSAHTLQAATPRPDPVRPRWLLTLILAVLGGLAPGTGLVVARDRLGQELESAEKDFATTPDGNGAARPAPAAANGTGNGARH